jgi:Zn-finger protein
MEPKDTVTTENFKGFTNKSCEFFPCHQGIQEEKFNCLFCYCPLAYLECPGPYKVLTNKDGTVRKDCSDCKLPHNGIMPSWNFIQRWMKHPRPWKGREQTKETIHAVVEANNRRIQEHG